MKSYWQQVTELGQLMPREELRTLLAPSNLHGWLAVATSYAIIVGAYALVHFWPNPITVFLSLILLGGRQLALAILTHEAVHKTLFASRRLNEGVGKWLCAYPMGISLSGYRAEHFEHHRQTGTTEDPDLGLVTAYPVSRSSMRRKLLRDAVGITGVKRVYFILLMGFGVITYTLSTNAKRIDQKGRSLSDFLRVGFTNLHGVLLTNVLHFTMLLALGAPYLYWLWLAAYLSPFSLFLRVRSIAEHACTPDRTHALLNSRTTHATLFARLTVAPHRVNYHLEHHLFMQVPYFNLPALRELLAKHHIARQGCSAKSYRQVIKSAIS